MARKARMVYVSPANATINYEMTLGQATHMIGRLVEMMKRIARRGRRRDRIKVTIWEGRSYSVWIQPK